MAGIALRRRRAAERARAARRLHHRSLWQGRARRGHHAPHPASRPAHHARLCAARRAGDGKPGRAARFVILAPVSMGDGPGPAPRWPERSIWRRPRKNVAGGRPSRCPPRGSDRLAVPRTDADRPGPGIGKLCRGGARAGVIPWALDLAAIEEDVFNLAVAQPVDQRGLDGRRLPPPGAAVSGARRGAPRASPGLARPQPGLPVGSASCCCRSPPTSCSSARAIQVPKPGWRRIGARTSCARSRGVTTRGPADACRPGRRCSAIGFLRGSGRRCRRSQPSL